MRQNRSAMEDRYPSALPWTSVQMHPTPVPAFPLTSHSPSLLPQSARALAGPPGAPPPGHYSLEGPIGHKLAATAPASLLQVPPHLQPASAPGQGFRPDAPYELGKVRTCFESNRSTASGYASAPQAQAGNEGCPAAVYVPGPAQQQAAGAYELGRVHTPVLRSRTPEAGPIAALGWVHVPEPRDPPAAQFVPPFAMGHVAPPTLTASEAGVPPLAPYGLGRIHVPVQRALQGSAAGAAAVPIGVGRPDSGLAGFVGPKDAKSPFEGPYEAPYELGKVHTPVIKAARPAGSEAAVGTLLRHMSPARREGSLSLPAIHETLGAECDGARVAGPGNGELRRSSDSAAGALEGTFSSSSSSDSLESEEGGPAQEQQLQNGLDSLLTGDAVENGGVQGTELPPKAPRAGKVRAGSDQAGAVGSSMGFTEDGEIRTGHCTMSKTGSAHEADVAGSVEVAALSNTMKKAPSKRRTGTGSAPNSQVFRLKSMKHSLSELWKFLMNGTPGQGAFNPAYKVGLRVVETK